MRIILDLPDPVWGRLASVADARGTTTSKLITSAITTLLPATQRPHHRATSEEEQQILTMSAAGTSIADIARKLNLGRSTVRSVLRRLTSSPTPIGETE